MTAELRIALRASANELVTSSGFDILSPELPEIPADLLGHYVVGRILYEPSFCDASYRFGGFVAPHRYLIISESARCLDAFSAHPEWGLCVGPRGRLLKVIDTVGDRRQLQITLLDLAEYYAANCEPEELAEIERFFAAKARELFAAALASEPLPELDTNLWRERLALPIGIDDEGRPFPCPQ